MKILFLFLFSFAIAQASDPKLQRLDPHGKSSLDIKKISSLKDLNECTVCHKDAAGKITLKVGVSDTCVSCHNKLPHSGAPEHMGKTYKNEKINCSTCHSPHRSEKKAMIKKDCTECHRWP